MSPAMSDTETSTVFYYEMVESRRFSPAEQVEGLTIDLVSPPDGKLNAEFYRKVGEGFSWTDRLRWSDADWLSYAESEQVRTYLASWHGERIGYCELKKRGNDLEIVYFGLLPPFLGKGLGGAFLSEMVRCAWQLPGVSRLWLHTCSGDHRNAARNYEARGFRHYKTEIESAC